MLYLNGTYDIRDQRSASGILTRGFSMGSHCRIGRKVVGGSAIIKVPIKAYIHKRLESGLQSDLTARCSDGLVWLERANDPDLYMVLSPMRIDEACNRDEFWAQGVSGTIRMPRSQVLHGVKTLHAVGLKYGSRHDWTDAVLLAKVGDVFSLTWSTGTGKHRWTQIIYVAETNLILDCPREKLHESCQKLGIDPASLPFKTWHDKKTGESMIERSEWKKI